MKCLYPKCEKKLKPTEECPDPLWCSLDCKEQLYMEQYLGSSLAWALEHKHNELGELNSEIATRELRIWLNNNPGKGFFEYLHSLGE